MKNLSEILFEGLFDKNLTTEKIPISFDTIYDIISSKLNDMGYEIIKQDKYKSHKLAHASILSTTGVMKTLPNKCVYVIPTGYSSEWYVCICVKKDSLFLAVHYLFWLTKSGQLKCALEDFTTDGSTFPVFNRFNKRYSEETPQLPRDVTEKNIVKITNFITSIQEDIEKMFSKHFKQLKELEQKTEMMDSKDSYDASQYDARHEYFNVFKNYIREFPSSWTI